MTQDRMRTLEQKKIKKKVESIDFDRYVPPSKRLKFKRHRIAKAAGRDPESLRDLTYDKLIELQWLTSSEASAISDLQDKLRRNG